MSVAKLNIECCPVCCAPVNVIERGATVRFEYAAPRWISVDERLPEKTGHYLTVIDCEKGKWVEVNTFDSCVHQWAHDLFHGQCIEDATPFVTHWMPLPEPPKEDT